MKKLSVFISTVILLVAPFKAQAAEPVDFKTVSNEFNFSYGVGGTPIFFMTTVDLMATIISINTAKFSNAHEIGSFSFEYEHAFFKHFEFGGLVSWQNIKADSALGSSKPVTHTHNFLSITPVFKFRWFDFEHVSMYTRLGVGVSLWFDPSGTEQKTTVFPNFELAGVCVDFGGKNLRGLVELGPSSKGIVAAGISYRF